MPIIKSAKKRVRVARKAAVRNSKTKRVLKGALKLFGRKASASSQAKAQSAVDTAVKKGVMHKNKAARVKKQLAAKAKSAGVKSEAHKKAAVKPAAKKAAPAKTAKAPAKKAVAKKPAAKKSTSKK
jgi:ribosomal protein S20